MRPNPTVIADVNRGGRRGEGIGGSSLRLKLLNQSHCTQTPSALGQMVRVHAALKLKSVTVTLSPRPAPHQVRMLSWDPTPSHQGYSLNIPCQQNGSTKYLSNKAPHFRLGRGVCHLRSRPPRVAEKLKTTGPRFPHPKLNPLALTNWRLPVGILTRYLRQANWRNIKNWSGVCRRFRVAMCCWVGW